MKKLIILLILLVCTIGCNQKSNIKIDVYKYDLSNVSKLDNTEFEILRTDENKMIINELDTLTDSFLFTTQSIIELNSNGTLINNYKINTHKRIVDFVEYKGKKYYFNLISKENKYYIELCNFDNNNETLIKKYEIEDPYLYSKFIKCNNQYYYKINSSLYNINNPNEMININSSFFFSKYNPKNESLFFKVTKDKEYQLAKLENDKIELLELKKNFGNFLVISDEVIYQSNDNQYLYSYNMKSRKEKCLFDKASIEDFALLNENIIVINTGNKLFYLDNDKIVYSMNKGDSLPWLHSDGNKSVYLSSGNYVYKFEM